MSGFGLDLEKLRPDIYLTEEQKKAMREQLIPPDICTRIRNMEPTELVAFIRYMASDYQCGGIPSEAYDRADSSVKNIQPVDCNKLYSLLNAIADNLGKQLQKGFESFYEKPPQLWRKKLMEDAILGDKLKNGGEE
jgi:hypothetical protein